MIKHTLSIPTHTHTPSHAFFKMVANWGYDEARVRVQSRCTVVPAKPTQRESLFLSCLDIFWQDIHYNQRLIFYEGLGGQADGQQGVSGQEDAGGRSHGAAVLEKLKSSLALCLVHYYPWCGRIAQSAHPPHRLFIDCSDAGVEFVEASVDLPLSLLAHHGFQMDPLFEQLCQHPDHKGDSLYSSPLLSIQATLFSDGGLALGIAQSHIVADGQSLWDFLVSWGECARGIPLSLPPLHNREKLALPNPPPMAPNSNIHYEIRNEDRCESDEVAEQKNIDVSINKSSVNKEDDGHIDGDKNDNCMGTSPLLDEDKGSPCKETSLFSPGDSSSLDVEIASGVGTDSLVQCVFILSDSSIKKLKHEAHGTYTSYEVICAHFWQHVTIARGRPQTEPTFFTVFANCRRRLSTPLPPAYFGNAIMFAVANNTVGKLSSENLSSIADRIHNAIATCQESSLMAFMHWVELHDNHAAFAFCPPIGQMVYMSSSPRFPFYKVDFGWGRPAAIRSVKVHGDGELVIFGGHSRLSHGDVEICMALRADVMKRLLEDPHFLAHPPLSTSKISLK